MKKVIYDPDQYLPVEPAMVTVGTFDGLHIGHQKIIQRLIDDARSREAQSILVTFEPHPQVVLRAKPKKLYLITTLEEKLEILSRFDLDLVVVIRFDFDFSQIPYDRFIESTLIGKLGMVKMVVGYDAALGKNREGTIEKILEHSRQHKYEMEVIPPVTVNNIVVNSTLVRDYIQNGYMEKVAQCLGRKYSIRGLVIRGDGRGKSLGYPTANILVEHPMKIMPPAGVYAVDVQLGEKFFKGMMNIGTRPTFTENHQTDLIPEVHIFDFHEDIYNQQIIIYFKRFVREEKKFPGVEELKKQLAVDEKLCRNV